MLVSLAERLSSTHTEDGVLTVVVPSLVRISPRSIDLLHTSPVGSPNLWFTLSSLAVPSSNSHMPSVSPSHFLSSLTPTVLHPCPPMSLLLLSTRTLISDLVLSSRSLTWQSQSTSKPPRTVTLPTRTSPGRSPRSLRSR
jgi:hypothetical protein